MEQWGCCPVCKFEVELRQGRTEPHARLHEIGSMRILCSGSYSYPCAPPAELTAAQETALMEPKLGDWCDPLPVIVGEQQSPVEQREVYGEPIPLSSLLPSTAPRAAPDGGWRSWRHG